MTEKLMRISATQLESWRYYLDSETRTEAEFIVELTGQRPPTLAMVRGTAFHKLMESLHSHAYGTRPVPGVGWDTVLVDAGGPEPLEAQRGNIIVDGDPFTFTLSPAIGVFQVPEGAPEIKRTREFPDHGIQLVGKADVVGRDGAITDYKTQDKGLDVERYFDSLQWRTYLLIFEATRFVYSWWRIKPAKRGDKSNYLLTEHETFEQFAYDGMQADVLEVAADLAEFRRSRGLENLYRRSRVDEDE